MNKPLSDTQCRHIKPGETLVDTNPHSGLRLTCGKGGTKSWIYRYRLDGKLRQVKLGHYPAMSLADARQELLKQKENRAQGHDPAAAKAQAKAATRAAEIAEAARPTLQILIDQYIEEHLEINRKRPREGIRLLTKEVPASMAARPAEEITRPDIQAVIDAKAKKAPRVAAMLRGELRSVYEHALLRARLPAATVNPVFGTKAPKAVKRDRALTDAELRIFLPWVKDATFSQSVKDTLMLTLLTAARSGEVVAMAWRDVDLNAKEWRQPTSKTGASHTVYLSDAALRILQRRRQEIESDWVFPRPFDSKSHINQSTVVYQLSETDRAGLARWTTHDLRRSAATGMARLGVSRPVIDRVLNHTAGGTTAIYDRHSYDYEARKAWNEWADHLAALQIANVLPIQAKA